MPGIVVSERLGGTSVSGRADEGFGAHPFGEIARATVAAQERSARLITAALESFAAATQAQLELTRAFLAPMSAQPEAFGSLVQGWNDAFLRLLEAAPVAQPRRPERD
jgi:hypothetical protein